MTKTIAEEVAELHELDVPALAARFEQLFGKPPRLKHRAWLVKRCAHQLQVARCGGLSEVARRRLGELMNEIDLPLDPPARTTIGHLGRPEKPRDPPVGTTLLREWRGRQVRVTVVEGGFEHEGIVHASLSRVAKVVTGSHWNGRLFFGLTSRKTA